MTFHPKILTCYLLTIDCKSISKERLWLQEYLLKDLQNHRDSSEVKVLVLFKVDPDSIPSISCICPFYVLFFKMKKRKKKVKER